MSFTDQKPWVATAEDLKQRWGFGAPGERFRCGLCGAHFAVGDVVRWQYTNDVPGCGGNPLVCQKCDGPKEKIIERIREIKRTLKVAEDQAWHFRRGAVL